RTGSVGDRNPIVSRHLLNARGSLSNALDRGFDIVPSHILHRAKCNLVLQRVNQLDVSDRAGQLTNQSSYAFVALATYAHRPRWRGSFAGAACPVLAHLAQKVSPDEAGTRSI